MTMCKLARFVAVTALVASGARVDDDGLSEQDTGPSARQHTGPSAAERVETENPDLAKAIAWKNSMKESKLNIAEFLATETETAAATEASIAEHTADREMQKEKQSAKVSAAYASAQRVAENLAVGAGKTHEDAKSIEQHAKQMVAEKELAEKAALLEEKEAEKASLAAQVARDLAEQNYGRAIMHKLEAEEAHATAKSLKDDTREASDKAQTALAKADTHKMDTAQKAAESAADAKEKSSQFEGYLAQSKALQAKSTQISAVKVSSEVVARDALQAKTMAEGRYLTAKSDASKAAVDKDVADTVADQTQQSNTRATDHSNVKTGLAFKALQDSVKSDVEAEHNVEVDKAVQSYSASVHDAMLRVKPDADKYPYVIIRDEDRDAKDEAVAAALE